MAQKNTNLHGLKLTPPKGPGTWIGKSWRELQCKILTCLLNPNFIVPVDPGTGLAAPQVVKITMGPNGWTALFPALAGAGATGGGSGTIPFLGSGPPSSSTLSSSVTYVATEPPSLYVDTTNHALYYCSTGGSSSTSVWTNTSGGTSTAPASYFAITGISNNDYFTAQPLTISYLSGVLQVVAGTAISVAKPNRQRTSISAETIDGVSITYSYYTSDNTRTASDGTNTEFQVCFPRYTTATTLGFDLSSTLTGTTALSLLESQCVIKAIQMPASGCGFLDGSANQIIWEEITTRVWARRYVQ